MTKPKNRHKATWPMTTTGSMALLVTIFALLLIVYLVRTGAGS
jgi:hypothetical protein